MGTMTKTSSRNNGCLTQRRECPCGDSKCFLKVDGDEDDIAVEPSPVDPNLPIGLPQITSDAISVDIPPFVGQSFQSDDEAQEYYTNFARNNGFAIRRERSKGNPAHPLGVYKRELVCHRAGASVPRKTAELKRQRNKKSSRCKCTAQMIIKKHVSKGVSRWMVVQFSNFHNHELLDSEEVRHLPAYRNICTVDREHILHLAKNGGTVNSIMRTLELDKGVMHGNLSFTERDLRNFLQSSKNINRENEGTELLKACKAMKDKDPDFRYDYTLDEMNKLGHIIWSYPDTIHAYKVFGDVVIFDASYRLYAYDRPLGVWFGLDNYGNVIFFGCCLLQDDKLDSFRWALQTFVSIMDGRPPRTMLTDLDIVLKDAMLSELPHTKHAVGMWHIMPKLASWFCGTLGMQYEKFVSEFQRLCNLENPVDFDQLWAQTVVDYGIGLDKHTIFLYYNRYYWAPPYLRGYFFGGPMNSGFLASIKSFFRGFLNSKIHLKDFVEQVAVAVDLLNQTAEEATMRQNYQNLKTKTCTPMEEHAMNILTPYAFKLFQKELIASMQYAVFETAREAYLVQHRLKADTGYIVRCVPAEEEITCSCLEFEACGVLCRHALRLLSLKNCFILPERYILIRWRKDSSLYPKSTGFKYRSLALRSLASILIQEAAVSKERFEYVQWHMSKLLGHVRNMAIADEIEADTDMGKLKGAVEEIVVEP